MKKCSICKETKSLEEFHFQNKKLNKRVSACRTCSSKVQKESRLKDIEETRRKDRENYQKTKEHRVEYARKYRENNKDKTRDTHLYSSYRIRQKDYLKMKEDQNGRCAICNEPEENLKRILCVDHCHETGKVRGLLCDTCNKFLGFYEKWSAESADYLQKYG